MSYYEILADEKDRLCFEYRPTPVTNPHFHSAYEFLFSVHGGQEVLVDGEKRVLQAGEGCFCDGYTVHAYTPNKTPAYILLGDKRYFDPTFAALGNKLSPSFFRFENFSLLDALLSLYRAPCKNGLLKAETGGGLVKILLAELAKQTEFVPRKTDKQSALVGQILRYAEENLTTDLSLQTLAKRFGYSHEHLSRILHRYLRESWNVYIGRLRVRKADALLTSRPDLPVLTVALECGFESPNTFYRAYKREFSLPPRRGK